MSRKDYSLFMLRIPYFCWKKILEFEQRFTISFATLIQESDHVIFKIIWNDQILKGDVKLKWQVSWKRNFRSLVSDYFYFFFMCQLDWKSNDPIKECEIISEFQIFFRDNKIVSHKDCDRLQSPESTDDVID